MSECGGTCALTLCRPNQKTLSNVKSMVNAAETTLTCLGGRGYGMTTTLGLLDLTVENCTFKNCEARIKIEPKTRKRIKLVSEHKILAFTRWYIAECQRQNIPVDGYAYDLPDAYADYLESKT